MKDLVYTIEGLFDVDVDTVKTAAQQAVFTDKLKHGKFHMGDDVMYCDEWEEYNCFPTPPRAFLKQYPTLYVNSGVRFYAPASKKVEAGKTFFKDVQLGNQSIFRICYPCVKLNFSKGFDCKEYIIKCEYGSGVEGTGPIFLDTPGTNAIIRVRKLCELQEVTGEASTVHICSPYNGVIRDWRDFMINPKKLKVSDWFKIKAKRYIIDVCGIDGAANSYAAKWGGGKGYELFSTNTLRVYFEKKNDSKGVTTADGWNMIVCHHYGPTDTIKQYYKLDSDGTWTTAIKSWGNNLR